MTRYILKRLLGAIPLFLLIVTMVFFMVRFVPGGPFDKERPTSPETARALNAYYGLDKPLLEQYFNFLKNLTRGELGPSYKYAGWSVNEIIAEKALVSLQLGASALVVAIILGLLMGLGAAAARHTKLGETLSLASLFGICLPTFVLAPVLVLIFSIKLKYFNAMGWNSFPSDAILPTISLALFYAAWIARLARNRAVEESSRAYVVSARAKGLSESRIYLTHIMRNAIQPVISYLGPAAAGMLTGSFVVESVFQISGLGRFFISSALDNDYTMIMGCVTLYAVFIIVFNLIADILLALVNPRIAKEFGK